MKNLKTLICTIALFSVAIISNAQESNGEEIKTGTYCFELKDIENSGNTYEATLNVDKNNNVQGQIAVENKDNHSFSVSFKGVLIGESLKVVAEYSNDVAGLPYEEDWKLSKNSFTGSHQPQVIMNPVNCK